jgi:triosephosphate isomerase
MCNLKSDKNLQEILKYKKIINNINLTNKEFVIFPSSIYLPFFYDTKYSKGTQNISKYQDGVHTGEILAKDLKSLKVSYALINHPEVEETEDDIIKKIKNATSSKIKVVLCIGKNTDNDIKSAIFKLIGEIELIFNKLNLEEKQNIILAFEPLWCVNKVNIVNLDYLKEIAIKIKEFIKIKYNLQLLFIYGGSINIDNIKPLLRLDVIDGYLIGSGAKNPENLLKIAEFF